DGHVTGVQTCALPIFGASLRSGRPHDWQKAEKNGADRHDLRPNTADRAFNYSVMQIADVAHATFGAKFFPGMIEIEQHDDTGFGIESGERDQSHPDRYTHVITEKPEEPKRAH